MPSTIVYTGNTVAAFDTWTFAPAALGSPPTSNFFTITVNTKSITYTAGSGDNVAAVCAGLLALLTASTIPEFAEYLWTASATIVTGTAKVAGIPGIFTKAVGNGGGSGTPTFTMTNTVAATGPNDVSNAANYSTGSLPGNGDTLLLNGLSPSLLYNLSSQSGVTLAELIITSEFTNTIGLPGTNANGYPEYRPTHWIVPSTLRYVNGSSAQTMKLDDSSVQTLTYMQNGTLYWRGSNASNVMQVTGGTLYLNQNPADSGVLATLNMANGTVNGSLTTTVAAINMTGGSLTLPNGWSGTAKILGGTATLGGGGSTVTALTVTGATVVLNMGGTSSVITTVTLNAGGVIDKSQNLAPITFTNITGNGGGGQVKDPGNVITTTNGYVKGTTAQTITFN